MLHEPSPSSTVGKRTTFQRIVYNPYLDYVTMLLVGAGVLIIYLVPKPKCNFINWDDDSISFPITLKQTVPMWLLLVLILPCTMIVLALIMVLTGKSMRIRSVHRAIFALLQALILQELFVEASKMLTGRYRPDFAARVQRYVLKNKLSYTPTYTELCASSDKEIQDGRSSFVSGHSASMFCSMMVISYVAFVRLKVANDGPHAITLPFLRLVVCSAPLFAALVVAVSRHWDHRHHISDIVGGALVGSLCALAVCRIHHRRFVKGLYPLPTYNHVPSPAPENVVPTYNPMIVSYPSFQGSYPIQQQAVPIMSSAPPSQGMMPYNNGMVPAPMVGSPFQGMNGVAY